MSAVPATIGKIERLEAVLLDHPAVDVGGVRTCEVSHHFGPDVYLRELRRPADTLIIGHAHKTAHLNILVKGRLSVYMDGKVRVLEAPQVFSSEPNVRKITYAHEDSILITVHPTKETSLEALEEELITKSESFQRHELQEAMRQINLCEAT